MTANIYKYATRAGVFVAVCALFCVPSVGAQSSTTAVDALQKARVLDRLAHAMPAEHKGSAPGFVLDPAWPQPLPHHWVIGDVGGIAVDKHDHIWVYHRPRSVSSTDSGMQGVAGADAKGKPISALGFPRPYGQLNGCCMPAPVGAGVRQSRQIASGLGAVRVIRASWRPSAASRTAVSGLRGSMASSLIRTTFVYIAGNGQAQFSWSVSVGAELRERFTDLEIQAGRHVRLPDRHCRCEGHRTATISTAASTGRRNLIWPADMVVIRRRTSCTLPTVTETGACLLWTQRPESTWDILALTGRTP